MIHPQGRFFFFGCRKALRDFSDHSQTLAAIETDADGDMEMEEVQVQPFCESLLEEIRPKVKTHVAPLRKIHNTGAKVIKILAHRGNK